MPGEASPGANARLVYLRGARVWTALVGFAEKKAGALYNALAPFKNRRINLTKIESRPSKRKAWDYYFFVDLAGHESQQAVSEALRELRDACSFIKVLGSYPTTQVIR